MTVEPTSPSRWSPPCVRPASRNGSPACRRCPACASARWHRHGHANAAYRAFSRRHGVAHQCVNLRAGERVRRGSRGAIHVRNVNSCHRRLRDWLARFHGVASRYLPNYLGWRRALDGGRVTSVEQFLWLAIQPIHSER